RYQPVYMVDGAASDRGTAVMGIRFACQYLLQDVALGRGLVDPVARCLRDAHVQQHVYLVVGHFGLRLLQVRDGVEIHVTGLEESQIHLGDGHATGLHSDLEERLVTAGEDEPHADDDQHRQHDVPAQGSAVPQELQIAGFQYREEAPRHALSSLPVSSRNRSSRVRARICSLPKGIFFSMSRCKVPSTSAVWISR